MYINPEKFPFKEMRPQQEWIVNEINKHPDKHIGIICASTGVGKSPLGITACQSYKKGYYLTLTKNLQDQLEKDFGYLSLVNLKGRSNYPCTIVPEQNCENGPCMASKAIRADCFKNQVCPYYNLRTRALAAQIFEINYAFMIAAQGHAEWFQSNNPRDICVFDEAHCLEDQLVSFAEFDVEIEKILGKYWMITEISNKHEILLKHFPDCDNSEEVIKEWIQLVYKACVLPKWEKLRNELEELVENGGTGEENYRKVRELTKEFRSIDVIHEKMANFITHQNQNWIFDINPMDKIIHCSPVQVHWVFEKYVRPLASNFIFMSASIIDGDSFIKTLGLPKDDSFFIQADSPFDPVKSPIFDLSCCSTNYKALQNNENLSKIKSAVEKIIAKHPHEKGLIHAGNFGIIAYLRKNIKNKRLLFRFDNITNDIIMAKHKASKEYSILTSASMIEGIDLYDDLSRFQVVIKMPFLSLANKRVKLLSEIDPSWYNSRMWSSVIQMCGRSTRSENDFAITYILDNKFNYWFNDAILKGWIPRQFQKRVRKGDINNV
jgi:Rad3-related DNA helicase